MTRPGLPESVRRLLLGDKRQCLAQLGPEKVRALDDALEHVWRAHFHTLEVLVDQVLDRLDTEQVADPAAHTSKCDDPTPPRAT